MSKRVKYQKGMSKTQINKANDLVKFLESKLYLGINKAVNYRHGVIVEFDYLSAKYKVSIDQEESQRWTS
jgi:hypothetical protein